ncbi:MAG: C39 family peptidase [candidate division Zixibacteria bacterium]|nr:C39 family peptidase [candidate division Zixibacteria bacterium]
MKAKAVCISAAFIVCLALAVIIRQNASGNFSIHNVDCYEQGKDWGGFEFENLSLNHNKNKIQPDTLDYPGYLESPPVKTNFDFNEILLSWNCDITFSSGLYFIISVSDDSITWHDFAYQKWGKDVSSACKYSNASENIEGIGKLDTDIIRLNAPMKYYRFSLTCIGSNNDLLLLDRISVCYSNTKANLRQFTHSRHPSDDIKAIALSVPFVSQHSLPDSISGKACSQASIAMVLNYHSRGYSPLEVSELAYDSYNDIYGNWLYNIQAAYLLGLKNSWIGRHNSFNEIAAEIYSGKPVAISISFENGQLHNAPYTRTDGHIIVVRGFDGKGSVLVNDPYGRTVSDGISAYDIDELTAVWIGHGGVAYHLWPE